MGIEHREVVDASTDTVWQWMARSGAFHRLVPPWQPMTLVQETSSLRDGTAKLKIGGLPWTAQHQPDGYVEGEQFVDQLTSFPLRLVSPWKHTHRFEAVGAGCAVLDHVQTPAPEAFLRSNFRYRGAQLRGDLAAHARWSQKALTVAVTGSSGLIGTQLCALLSTGGHRVIKLVRGEPSGDGERRWNPDAPAVDLLAGVDAVVHLAGASIAGRFTDAHKKAVLDSRVGPTKKLAERAAQQGVSAFVSSSAIGYYGADRGDEVLSESSAPGDDFLAEVVTQWEQEAEAAGTECTRVVQVRTGIVVTPDGGFLKQLRPLFALGVGGRLGSGEQWLSWIGIDDMLDIYLRAIVDDAVEGPVNAVAPNPVRNSEFTKVLGSVMHRPTLVPTPAFGPRLLLGEEGSKALAEASQRVDAGRLTELAHPFRHTELDATLRHVLGKG
ncbi:TIGR01777 family oxidoreductase [Nakamurella sp. A5-74]|uniref:TIGR01777 family oxidoreductase n=1 Tax=Nakamurella sp. A5-74 TaxID=3158264 RepID=A0AAU8DMZ3_9ACTN